MDAGECAQVADFLRLLSRRDYLVELPVKLLGLGRPECFGVLNLALILGAVVFDVGFAHHDVGRVIGIGGKNRL